MIELGIDITLPKTTVKGDKPVARLIAAFIDI